MITPLLTGISFAVMWQDVVHNNPVQLGGPGSIVEIHESLFAGRKYNRGRIVPEQWVFGGYEADTKEEFLVTVSRRDAAMPIIREWVRPGTNVWYVGSI